MTAAATTNTQHALPPPPPPPTTTTTTTTTNHLGNARLLGLVGLLHRRQKLRIQREQRRVMMAKARVPGTHVPLLHSLQDASRAGGILLTYGYPAALGQVHIRNHLLYLLCLEEGGGGGNQYTGVCV